MTTADLTAMSGLELMRWVQTERSTDIPHFSALLGMRVDTVENSHIVVSLDTRPDFTQAAFV
ncbi:hypothetical protein OG762_45175 [Streptomyces sp. NBC_01136]|uniref:hypothetical protein n=1 Tax=unclassified Streptomyces TaxID=2593676 RepID=UPI003255B6CF|nr:hypothetical protein OG762_45175 [Streptomyces sp. NBC_01136]